MKSYNSIGGPSQGQHKPCHVYVKYDGTNLRFEYSKKRGWYKFGTRRMMIDQTHPIYGRAIDLFLDKYESDLSYLFNNKKIFYNVQNVVVFAEWFGSKSFSGQHFPDDSKDIIIFDANLHKKGFLDPKLFNETFYGLDVAEEIMECNFGPKLVDDVRKENIHIESLYKIKTEIPEGVICKGGSGHRRWMCKIKTNRYKTKLMNFYETDWEKFWE